MEEKDIKVSKVIKGSQGVQVLEKVGSWVSLVVGFQAFLKQLWKYLALIFAGVIAGLVYGMKQIKPVQHITTEEFINEQSKDLHVGKLKQKGQGNVMEVELPELPEQSKREARKEIRLERRKRRKEIKELKDSKAEVANVVVIVGLILSFRGWY